MPDDRCDQCGLFLTSPVAPKRYLEIREVRVEATETQQDWAKEPGTILPRDVRFCDFYCLSMFVRPRLVGSRFDALRDWPGEKPPAETPEWKRF